MVVLGLAVVVAAMLAGVRSVVDDTESIERAAERVLGSSSPGLLDGQE